ncbi:hypothetical protein A6K41_06180 [Listeria monocytogenes]|uniref:hypothetical protein n=1 Tax=Listeria monocytogenes TaxID=1639 RepID=UPI0009ADB8F1|nr:hypothetical protein [Listeria monocytogenes]AQZ43493.1 hypothetical protein A6K41_06180 [Listeria monocytogenes]
MNEQEAKAIVLEWLKRRESFDRYPTENLFELKMEDLRSILPEKVTTAYKILSRTAEYELLAEFAAWGLREVAE